MEIRGATLSERKGRRSQVERDRLRDPEENPEGARLARLLAGRLSALLGVLSAVGGVIVPIVAGGANVIFGALGVMLGTLAYFLDARRIGTIAVVLSIAALFFGLAASQGLIPGLEATDRSLPGIKPNAGEN